MRQALSLELRALSKKDKLITCYAVLAANS